MLKSRPILIVLLLVVLAGFVGGVIYLFQLRFNAGDVYPPYSSLRTDPLGAKILYESLQNIPTLSVSRFFQASSKLEGNKQTALFIVGASEWNIDDLSREDYRTLQNFLFAGGRIVISLLPVAGNEQTNHEDNPFLPKKKPEPPGAKDKEPKHHKPVPEEASEFQSVSLLKTNALTLETDRLLVDENDTTEGELAVATDKAAGLPRTILWHSAAYFGGATNRWHVIYRRKGHAVMIERAYGPGSLVLSTDSYFVSNEALRKDRHAELLVWLLGHRHEILFDETHLGVEEQLGIAVLMRRYHLEGILAGLLLVAGLFVWKNSVSLVPPPPDDVIDGQGALIAGKESSAGFASLLRRSLPPRDITLTCFAEWKTAFARDPRAAARLPDIQKIIDDEQARPPGSRRPLESYQQIQQILTQRHL